jgi:NAD+ kinase
MKIAIYGQYYQNSTEPIIRDIFVFLAQNNVSMVIESEFLEMLHEKGLITKDYMTFTAQEGLDSSYDMLISIGGDGTILRAITLVGDSGVPILGINAGRLGFLATVQKDHIESFLKFILEKRYKTSERTLICLHTDPPIEELAINFALNEISVSRKETTSMITIETHLNDELLTSYWADGLIVATPTGSTGYSLSCGGPILMPAVSSFAITPIAPHNLNARPLVIPDDTVITMKVSGRENQYLVSLDSRTITVPNDSVLTVRKNPFKVKMVEIPDETFLKTLRSKLLWGEDKRN